MSDYTQITFFAPKDALTTGNPAKKIKGAEFDPEFNAISTAILSKFDTTDVASNAEAAALSSDAKLITPAKLSYALTNASITLGANILLNGGIAATDIVRKSVASTITANLTMSNNAPRIIFNEADAGLDQKNTMVRLSDTRWTITSATDAAPTAAVADAVQVVRGTGTSWSAVNIGANLAVTGNISATGSVTIAGGTAWHSGNDGAASGLDADLLDGFNSSSADTASTVAVRDSGADLWARYHVATSGAGENPVIDQFMVTNVSNGYMRKASLSSVREQLGLEDGTYTPTVTAGTNCTVTPGTQHNWSRVGDTVTVSGSVGITVTNGSAVLTNFTVSLPIASTFVSSSMAAGSGSTNTSNGAPCWVVADTGTHRLGVSFFSTTSGGQTVYFIAQYKLG